MGIRDIRIGKNLTMKQVAEKAGLTEAAISLYERGMRTPTLKNAKKLAAALGITVNELVERSEAS